MLQCKRLFSSAGYLVNKTRSSLDPDTRAFGTGLAVGLYEIDQESPFCASSSAEMSETSECPFIIAAYTSDCDNL